MAWAIYSAEKHPKWDEENHHQADYIQALGVQVCVEAHSWKELEDLYRIARYESWVDAAGEGREAVITGRQVAERLAGDFRLHGIGAANLDRISPEEKSRIEAKCEENNLKRRRQFV